jgi:hypothetical protein
MESFLSYELPCIFVRKRSEYDTLETKQGEDSHVLTVQNVNCYLHMDIHKQTAQYGHPMDILLTSDFDESHLKNLVKKGGSLPSITIKIGVSWERFSIRKSSSRNF